MALKVAAGANGAAIISDMVMIKISKARFILFSDVRLQSPDGSIRRGPPTLHQQGCAAHHLCRERIAWSICSSRRAVRRRTFHCARRDRVGMLIRLDR